VFAAIDAFEYPELHDESIAARSFFSQLSKLLAVCGVKDFGMKVGRPALSRKCMRFGRSAGMAEARHACAACG
jgi:hypothetical protein